MNHALDFLLSGNLTATLWAAAGWIIVANLGVYGALYALRGLRMLLLTGHSVCPAGGVHVGIDRGKDLGLEGFPVSFQLTLPGPKGVWVQQWRGCRKCGCVFVDVDRIEAHVMANVGPQAVPEPAVKNTGKRR